ncbi:MAG: hemin uptake protein HemP [Sulfuritalea sp.]|nr:hemin uptake protein HemP [Sulfuritalea sp.]
METVTQPARARPGLPSNGTDAPRPLDSTTLLGAKGEVEITHQGETYRLRRTRQGKLILTK